MTESITAALPSDANASAIVQLVERVQRCRHLPSPPAVAMRVLELVEHPDCSAETIGNLIAQDPALASKLLKTVNSAFYARATPVSTVPQAVVIMGLQAVQTLVLGFSLITELRSKRVENGFNHSLFWQRSIYGATAARLLAVKADVRQVEEAFLAALMRDIGMLALDSALGAEYGKVLGYSATAAQILEAETNAYGCTHADLGGELTLCWKFPPVLTEPIRYHHGHTGDATDETAVTLKRLCLVVAYADRLAETFLMPDGAQLRQSVIDDCVRELKLTPQNMALVVNQIEQQAAEVAKLYEINLSETTQYEAILNQANDQLVDRTLRSQAEATQLQVQAAQMQEKAAQLEVSAAEARKSAAAMKLAASFDALTGLLNRGHLDEQLALLLEAAVKTSKPFAVAMLDLDKFKSLNDTYGHPAGDAVLKFVARLLKSMCGSTLIPARYGGEEMTVLMPNCDRTTALPNCESIRQRIEQSVICYDGLELKVTASIGLAAFEPQTAYKMFSKPTILMKAADLALYRAKESGRNRTKVCLLPTARPELKAA